MITVTKIQELKTIIKTARSQGKMIGFVPTMGYLHEGHLSLARQAKRENDLVVVSIFVNPIQFGPKEDFQTYPRDLKRDQELLESVGVEVVFTPEKDEVYPANFQTLVEVTGVSQGLCGQSRPGHFKGVATVVAKLFNIVAPDRAYFGAKDAQQLRVIRQMTTDLNFNIEIISCPIIRESDGLAMSSRNVYLNPDERRAALVLYRALQTAEKKIAKGDREAGKLAEEMISLIQAEPLAVVDYVEIVDSKTLEPIKVIAGEVLIALAVRIGKTRLIDNMVFLVK
ncbi:MAG TPA: pantoate--beta-alanine ligase [Bacillota bacterium]|nr:pantoate--beta-alanine ligase [Bacillota bacterium]